LPKSAQNKGLSKAIFRDLYKQYQNAGVKKIEVYANIDVGGSNAKTRKIFEDYLAK
jgi:hypothetical protein